MPGVDNEDENERRPGEPSIPLFATSGTRISSWGSCFLYSGSAQTLVNWQLAIGKLSFLLQMLVLYYLETWEGKDGRDGGRRIAEAFLSTLGEASVVAVVFVLFTGIDD